jgi:hypothetical protein
VYISLGVADAHLVQVDESEAAHPGQEQTGDGRTSDVNVSVRSIGGQRNYVITWPWPNSHGQRRT